MPDDRAEGRSSGVRLLATDSRTGAYPGLALPASMGLGPASASWVRLWRRFSRNPGALIGLVLLVALTVVAIVGPSLVGNPTKQDIVARMTPPNPTHPMGTDEFGRDILSRVVNGTRISLLSGVGAVGVRAGVWRAFRHVFGLLRRRGRDRGDGGHGHAFGAARGAAGSFDRRRPGAEPGDRQHRHRGGQRALLCATDSKRDLGVRNQEYLEAARAIGARDLRIIRSPATKCAVGTGRPGNHRDRQRDTARVFTGLSRPRRTAAHTRVGGDAQRGPPVHRGRAIHGHLSWTRHHVHGHQLQPGWRRPARCPGSRAG